jgi:hypothetical protein
MRQIKKSRKGQVLSLDLMLSMVLFTVIVILFVGFFIASGMFKKPSDYDYEIDYIFDNLEVNLNDPYMHKNVDNRDFLNGARVNASVLRDFANDYSSRSPPSIDEVLIGNIGDTKGIGMFPDGYDICLYFTDNDNTPYDMSQGGNILYLGYLKGGSCNEVMGALPKPCEGYKDVVSIFKPVLLDFGDYTKNRVVQMNVVVCKI